MKNEFAIDKAGIKYRTIFYHVHISLWEDCGLDRGPYEN